LERDFCRPRFSKKLFSKFARLLATEKAYMSQSAPTNSLETAFAHCQNLLLGQPELALEQALAILEVAPGHPQAVLYVGVAHRRMGQVTQALETLGALSQSQPNSADVAFELGLTLIEIGQNAKAQTALSHATKLRPTFSEAWRALGDLHMVAGQTSAADEAYAHQIRASTQEPQLLQAAVALTDGKLAIAEGLLRDYLRAKPHDAPALRMLSVVAMRLGRMADAELILQDCLDVAPAFIAARRSYASLLYRANKSMAALEQLDLILKHDPKDPNSRNMRAAVLAQIGDFEGSIAHYESVLNDFPNQPKAWQSYGHALKTVGRVPDAIEAYRTAISQAPHMGEAWWSLANLKTFKFSDTDIAMMRSQLAITTLSEDDRLHLNFALGKAFEDKKDYDASFKHYASGNAGRRAQVDYDPADLTDAVSRAIEVYTADYFAARQGWGHSAPDPIFVIGLPRSGSTLIEQILSSHSQIEGTTELPDIIALSKKLGQQKHYKDRSAYPEAMLKQSQKDCEAMGQSYLETTRIQRQTDRVLFIDKMPNNFQHLGLIATILPNAKIIDARRHPMGCCFAGFKQHFARGQNFSTSLEDIGQYYLDYLRMMDHFDTILPGRVHRVCYEDMVADSETEIRALLTYCGLDFEESCLNFHENERAVRTPSSEQVRQPIYNTAQDLWKYYENNLEILQNILCELIDNYDNRAPRH
jgi:tetratricopeptide (TPR) repeat protein